MRVASDITLSSVLPGKPPSYSQDPRLDLELPSKQKGLGCTNLAPFISLEAASGSEPEKSGSASRCLTTWLCRHNETRQQSDQRCQQTLADVVKEASGNVVHEPLRRGVLVFCRFRLGALSRATSKDQSPDRRHMKADVEPRLVDRPGGGRGLTDKPDWVAGLPTPFFPLVPGLVTETRSKCQPLSSVPYPASFNLARLWFSFSSSSGINSTRGFKQIRLFREYLLRGRSKVKSLMNSIYSLSKPSLRPFTSR